MGCDVLTVSPDRESGFTLIELIVALAILTTVILGLSLSAGSLGVVSANAEVDAAAVQAVEDRITLVSLDDRYEALDSLYTATESGLPNLPGATRETAVTRIQTTDGSGNVLDYHRVTVSVSGGPLSRKFARTIAVAAP